MRNIYTLFGFLLLIAACSPKTTPSSSNYQEDLSVYRPDYVQLKAEQKANREKEEVRKQTTTSTTFPVTNDITTGVENQLAHFAEANAGSNATKYTIQVYSGTSREEANEIKERVYEDFPSGNPKVTYKQPTYRVRVGDFYNRVDAYLTYEKLRRSFRRAIVVPYKVQLGEKKTEGADY
ncbi:SPOR domain-containing protein [Persicobacter sp. CCB-QB2]|uniref:SPOR domain-containing protein n=1 Tax=Persicobacter sp. CCB-QB2 TaxID=1561025 RepID=UPI0006A96E61|nr:SPOR domain-containing protein [Persicobacter sp. CCB-QB2]